MTHESPLQEKPKKLLDQVREAMRFKHYAYRTEDSVRLYWMTPDAFKRALVIGEPPIEEPPAFYIV
jgi:hypothetical protein